MDILSSDDLKNLCEAFRELREKERDNSAEAGKIAEEIGRTAAICRLDEMPSIIEREWAKICTHPRRDGWEKHLLWTIAHYSSEARTAQADMANFRDETCMILRGIVMLAEAVSKAHTHGEKASRLRGLIEVCEEKYNELREKNLEYMFNQPFDLYSRWQSTYPVRELLERIRKLENELGYKNRKPDEDEPPF